MATPGSEVGAGSTTIVDAALSVLLQPDPWKKAELTQQVVAQWRAGQLPVPVASRAASRQGDPLTAPRQTQPCAERCGTAQGAGYTCPAPDRPARADDKVRLVAPGQMPRLGKGGTLESRQAIVHSLCHIESWAIDLSWDAIARWGSDPEWAPHLPWGFYDDFVTVADDEARHFLGLAERLVQMGTEYGALPAHDGLWESASSTAGSLAARLAVEHCVHEARGLDVLPSTIDKFRRHGDQATTALLEGTIYPEEVTHCAAGVRWLRHLHGVAHGNTPQQQQQQQEEDGAGKGTPQADTPPGAADSAAVPHDVQLSQLQLLQLGADDAEGGCSSQTDARHPHTNNTTGSSSGSGGSPGQCHGSDSSGPSWMVEARQYPTVQQWFHHLVRQHFSGVLKPPFNDLARAQAGFEESWYLPLCVKPEGVTSGTIKAQPELAQGISCGVGAGSTTIVDAALSVLLQPDPWKKAELTQQVVAQWRAGQLPVPVASHAASRQGDPLTAPRQTQPCAERCGTAQGAGYTCPAPDRPARADDKVRLVAPGQMPRLGKGGTLESRQAIVHSLCHIESWAIDLSWDAIARWGSDPEWAPHLPWGFYDDFVTVADDEARHFLGLAERLVQMGTEYGALPAHDGLWESASSTAGSLAARLAVEHCVHEARGLDVLPSTIDKFRRHGDQATTALLEGTIYPEEVTHCAAGVRWLRHLHGVAHGNTPQQQQQQQQEEDGAGKGTPQADTPPGTADSAAVSHDVQLSQLQRLQLGADDAEGGCSTQTDARHPHTNNTTGSGSGVSPGDCHGSSRCGAGCNGSDSSGPSWMVEARQYPTVQQWFHHLVRQHFSGVLKPPFNDLARAQAGFEESWYLPLCVKPEGVTSGTIKAQPELAQGISCGGAE